jgi:hypothetical protein
MRKGIVWDPPMWNTRGPGNSLHMDAGIYRQNSSVPLAEQAGDHLQALLFGGGKERNRKGV